MPILYSRNRYSVLFAFISFFLLASFVVRTALLTFCFSKADITLLVLLRIYLVGAFFDLGVAFFLSAAYSVYLLLLPQRWNNSLFNKIITYAGFFIITLIVMFSFFAEFTFWQEFESRFNFIAVDYLVYTFEVISNINQSYPLPLLVSGMVVLTLLVTWLFYKKNIFSHSFLSNTPFLKRLGITGVCLLLVFLYAFKINNSMADRWSNRYQDELSKAGIYSFFSAFKNNELNYRRFYKLIDTSEAFNRVRSFLAEPGAVFTGQPNSIRRTIPYKEDTVHRPNVIMVTIESLSADFLKHFGNTQGLTPVLDSLADNSISFNNLYATGTRTVRGMEALSLAIPPTPGNSIVRRSNNNNLYTIGSVFRQQGYDRTFFYGGDGYFDNMNQYFGSNGFDIVDRGRKLMVGDAFKAKRTIIPDNEVHFENAWGISDEDIYDAVIKQADEKYKSGRPFYDFVMTTSNHRPFTYPEGKINIPCGSREGAVRYTDYAIGQLLKKASLKPWFTNTVFIFVADHCASSAGKNAIDISKYHIPCLIVNLRNAAPRKIETMCSQIDIYPTLFSMLGWQYTSNFYGKDITASGYVPRIVSGTYQKLAYMRHDSLVVLSPQQSVACYRYNKANNEQIPVKPYDDLVKEAIAQYQTAYYLYKDGGLKE